MFNQMKLLMGQAEKKVYPTEIDKSILFTTGTSDYLTRTPSAAGDQQKFTIACWYKPGSTPMSFYDCRTGSSTTDFFRFITDSAGSIGIYSKTSNVYTMTYTSPDILVDITNWYHIVLAVDTTESVEADRVKLWINGRLVELTASIAATQDLNTAANRAVETEIGRSKDIPTISYRDGYIADYYFVDGQAVAPTVFGQQSDNIDSLWIPKAFSGTYGTNGYYLDFKDDTNLGKDISGNTNNFTVNGTPTQTLDTPTYNCCVFSSLRAYSNDATFSNGNTEVYKTGSFAFPKGTMGVSTGKFYYEVTYNGNRTTTYPLLGFSNTSDIASALPRVHMSLGTSIEGHILLNGTDTGSSATLATTLTTGDIFGFGIDADTGEIRIWQNGVALNGGAAIYTITAFTEDFCPQVGVYGQSLTANFGATAFHSGVPENYLAFSYANLEDPAISTLNPAKGNDIVLYTGTGTNKTISELKFSPSLINIKDRSSASNWIDSDATRGETKILSTNSSGLETTEATSITAFNADGFSIGTYGPINTLDDEFIAQCFKEGPDYGLDIIKYTGDGTDNRAITCDCGGTPDMIIVKSLTSTGNWAVYHKDLGVSKVLYLNLTNAAANLSDVWKATSATSFTIGTNALVNTNGVDYIAYVFKSIPGFSRSFVYTGNGLVNGPYTGLDFRPRNVLIKNTSGAYNWLWLDTERDKYNTVNTYLSPNTTDGDSSTYNWMNVTSSGFKVVATNSPPNANYSGHLMVGMAWAEQPSKYSNAF